MCGEALTTGSFRCDARTVAHTPPATGALTLQSSLMCSLDVTSFQLIPDGPHGGH